MAGKSLVPLDGENWTAYIPETYDAYIKLSSCTDWEVSRNDGISFMTNDLYGQHRVILINKTDNLTKYMLTGGDTRHLVDRKNCEVTDVAGFLNEDGNGELGALNEFSILLLQEYGFKGFDNKYLLHPIYTSWVSGALDAKHKHILNPILDRRDFYELYNGALGDRIRTAVEDRFFNDKYEIFKCLSDENKKRFGLDTVTDDTASLSKKEREGVALASDGISYCILRQITDSIIHCATTLLRYWSLDLGDQMGDGASTVPVEVDTGHTIDRTDFAAISVPKWRATDFLVWLERAIDAHDLGKYCGEMKEGVASACLNESFDEYVCAHKVDFDIDSCIVKEITRIFSDKGWEDESAFGRGGINRCLGDWYDNIRDKEE